MLAASFAGLALTLVTTACSGGGNSVTTSAAGSPSAAARPAGPASSAVSLSETGSTLLFPLFNLWAPAYQEQYSQVSISTAGTGSGKGISGAAAGTADIGASDAYLSSGQQTQSPALENIPLAVSAQQISFNLQGIHSLKLNGTVLAGIYQGTITNWDDQAIARINPGVTLPDQHIVPVRRSDSSGDTFLFTSYLSAQDPAWKSALAFGTTVAWPGVGREVSAKGNSGMVTACQAHPGCVAYIGISYEDKTSAAGLGQAELLNGAGNYESPTATTISAGANGFTSETPAGGTISMINGSAAGSYPIVNYEYGVVSTAQHSAAKAQTLKAFLHWAITTGNGATYLSKVNFQPLPASVVSISSALIARISS
ncbi:MAG: phosphate ABC transporter substrate-binding protein PstS [Actinobacteria bacterium]|nr:phosphate ABC transporter substrate-binding protein PstS [Actinomycetota bacterium]